MSESVTTVRETPHENIFTPFVQPQTYLNILYLLLAFPLGIFYLVYLVVGLSIGFSLLIVVVGAPILLLTLAGWWALCSLERTLAIRLLGASIPPMTRQEDDREKGLWPWFRTRLTSPVTWKGLVYLFVKFPLGIFSFVVVITLVSISLGLIVTPIFAAFDPVSIDIETTSWVIDNSGEALLAAALGIGLGILSVYLFNWLAYASGWFAAVMLGDARTDSTDEPPPTRGMAQRPTLHAGGQARTVGGAILVVMGILLLVGQFLDLVGRFVGPAVLVLAGVLLLVPLVREAIADTRKPDEPAAPATGEDIPKG